jgi:hypothetical protein
MGRWNGRGSIKFPIELEEDAMSTWTNDELQKIGAPEELHLASVRRADTPPEETS